MLVEVFCFYFAICILFRVCIRNRAKVEITTKAERASYLIRQSMVKSKYSNM